jgi:hypothetical protein
MAASSLNIPHVLSSETVEGLRDLMLKNNLETNKEHHYYQIVHDSKRFHAFYMKEADDINFLKKKKTPNTK